MPPDTMTCRVCGEINTDPQAVRMRWCGHCRHLQYSQIGGLVELNEVLEDLHTHTLGYLGSTIPQTMVSVSFEQFMPPDGSPVAWRCFVRSDGRVRATSKRPHETPAEALRELYEIVQAEKPTA